MYVVIAGGGVLGLSLARKLIENRHDVVVVERDQAACEAIAARIGALAIHGNATDIDMLEEAGMRKAEVAVAATPHDGDNLAFCMLAKNFGVPRLFARMLNPRYEGAYEVAGVERCVNVSQLWVGQLVLEIEQPTLRQVATFGRGKAAIVVATLPKNALVHGMSVKDVAQDDGFPQDCVIAGIFRPVTEDFFFPRGSIELLSGDQVFLAADTDTMRKAAAFLQRVK